MSAALAIMVCQSLAAGEDLSIPPASHRAAIVLRALAYRRSLEPNTGDLALAIIDASGAASVDGQEMAKALATLAERVQVGGRRVRILRIRYTTVAAITEALLRERVEVAYLPAGLAGRAALLAAPTASGRLLVCAEPDAVGMGCHLSVEAEGDGARLVVDVTAAQRAGVRFDARLLQLARVVGQR